MTEYKTDCEGCGNEFEVVCIGCAYLSEEYKVLCLDCAFPENILNQNES